MIDNYEEIVQRIATEEKPQVMAAIEKNLYDWAAKTQGIMIKTERDTFVYVFEQKYLEEMHRLSHVVTLLYWDMRTCMPKGGFEKHADSVAYFSTKEFSVLQVNLI